MISKKEIENVDYKRLLKKCMQAWMKNVWTCWDQDCCQKRLTTEEDQAIKDFWQEIAQESKCLCEKQKRKKL